MALEPMSTAANLKSELFDAKIVLFARQQVKFEIILSICFQNRYTSPVENVFSLQRKKQGIC